MEVRNSYLSTTLEPTNSKFLIIGRSRLEMSSDLLTCSCKVIMICVRNFFVNRDETLAVMHEEAYSLFTPCLVYEDIQILPARFTMCLVGANPTLLQGNGEELVQSSYIVQRVGRNLLDFLRLCTMLVAEVDNGGSALVRTTFMRFFFR